MYEYLFKYNLTVCVCFIENYIISLKYYCVLKYLQLIILFIFLYYIQVVITTFQLLGSDQLIKLRNHSRLYTILPTYFCVSRVSSFPQPLRQRRHTVNVESTYKCSKEYRDSPPDHTASAIARRERNHYAAAPIH